MALWQNDGFSQSQPVGVINLFPREIRTVTERTENEILSKASVSTQFDSINGMTSGCPWSVVQHSSI